MALSVVQQIPDYDAFMRYSNNPIWSALVGQYRTAKEDYDKESALALGKIDKNAKLADAFRELQAAENVRDQSPEAYQEARVRYYTLLEGEEWAAQEQERILKAEAKPKADNYLAQYMDLTARRNQQQQTMDVVTAVKDKVLSMKDDFVMTTDVFSKQIAELKNQIQLESKAKEETTANVVGWIDTILNGLLVVVLLVAVFVIGRTVVTRATSAYTPSPTIK